MKLLNDYNFVATRNILGAHHERDFFFFFFFVRFVVVTKGEGSKARNRGPNTNLMAGGMPP